MMKDTLVMVKLGTAVLLSLALMLATIPTAAANDNPSTTTTTKPSYLDMHLQSLVELDAYASYSSNISRQGNVDTTGDGLGICRLDYMVGLSMMNPKRGRVPTNRQFNIEGAAAVALAIEHLNTGNGTVVPEVAGLNERCNIRFRLGVLDSYWNQQKSVDQIIDMTQDDSTHPPCAIIGNAFSRVSMSTSMITSMKGFLQVSFSTATELDDKSLFGLHGRIRPSLEGNVQTLIRYLHQELGVNHLAVLHTDTRESQSYSVALQQAAAILAPNLQIVSIDVDDDFTPEVVQIAVQKLKETQFRYFLGAIKRDNLEALYNESVAQGIAGTGEHTWFLPGAVGTFKTMQVSRESPLAEAVPGTNLIMLEGFWKTQQYDRLAASLQELGSNAQDKHYLLSKFPNNLPPGATLNQSIFHPILNHPSFLQKPPTSGMVTWAYDAAIAAGLAACQAANQMPVKDESTPPYHNYFDGKAHFQAFTETSFQGTSGNVTFDPVTGTRQHPNFRIVNIQKDEANSNATHLGFKEVTSGMYMDGSYQSIAPALYSDGTSDIPLDLPQAHVDPNYLSPQLRATGWAMATTVVALALGSMVWVRLHRHARVVLSAQPIFLHLVAIGVAIAGVAIVPLSIDRNSAASPQACHASCMSVPWLLSIGFSLTFSALWAKTHRVNKLLAQPNFRRMTVSPWDVARPMLVVLCSNVVVLSCWTALSPLQCEEETMVWDAWGRPMETRGYCASEHSMAYWIALGAINFGPLVFAVYEAFVARHIATEYSETEYILKSLIVLCLVCFLGIPVLVIAHDNPAAYFFVQSAMIFLVGISLLVLIFLPKLRAFYNIKFFGNQSETHRTLPERFSRSKRANYRSSYSASDASCSRIALGGSMYSSDRSGDSFLSGIMVLNHPQMQVQLEEENKELREQNDRLIQTLRIGGRKEVSSSTSAGTFATQESHAEFSTPLNDEKVAATKEPATETQEDTKEETAAEEYKNAIRRLQEENEELRKSLLQHQHQQKVEEEVSPSKNMNSMHDLQARGFHGSIEQESNAYFTSSLLP